MPPVPPSLHRTIWRWHFYAGLFVAPFLLVLAVTGSIYLFDNEINDALQPHLRFASAAGPPRPVSEAVAAVERAFPGGKVDRIDMPTSPGRTAQLFLTPASGEPVRIFVDPGTAAVLGSHVYTHTLVGFADVAHGSLFLGRTGDAIVELAACWGIVLIVSGAWLWWPRGGRSAVVRPRAGSHGRRFWRDLHQCFGVYTAVLVLFLILTGLPWAGVWGGKLLASASNAAGLGYPEGARRPLQSTSAPSIIGAIGEAPWTLHHAPMPASSPGAACVGGRGCEAIGVDAAVRVLNTSGMTEAYRLFLPRGPRGVYMAYLYPDRPQGQRTLQIDQYSGAVLGDIAFADYGAVAKAVEWGVAIHMGNYFGRANQILMLMPCVGIIGLSVTGFTMWWRRRPPGSLGAPPKTADTRLGMGVIGTIAALGVFFPLAGLSMIAIFVLEAASTRWLGSRR